MWAGTYKQKDISDDDVPLRRKFKKEWNEFPTKHPNEFALLTEPTNAIVNDLEDSYHFEKELPDEWEDKPKEVIKPLMAMLNQWYYEFYTWMLSEEWSKLVKKHENDIKTLFDLTNDEISADRSEYLERKEPITFTIEGPAPPNCNLDKLEEYKKNMQKLCEPEITWDDERDLKKGEYDPDEVERTYKYIDDDDKYGKKIFTVLSIGYRASVTNIECIDPNKAKRKSEGKCNKWTGNCDGEFHENTIEVTSVNMRNTNPNRGEGNCTKAVAYLIKTLMLEAEKRADEFPYKGKVYLSSNQACAASNCYIKAFMLNGFDYEPWEIEAFQEDVAMDGSGDFTFTGFRSKKQKKRFEEEQKRLATIAGRVTKRRRKNYVEEAFAKLKF